MAKQPSILEVVGTDLLESIGATSITQSRQSLSFAIPLTRGVRGVVVSRNGTVAFFNAHGFAGSIGGFRLADAARHIRARLAPVDLSV